MVMDEARYIRVGHLLDGSGGPARKDVLLTVRAGRFSAIEPYRAGDLPDAARLIDLSRCTITPPLVDCHVHLALAGSIDKVARARQFEADYSQAAEIIARHLGYHFAQGIFAVRDGGDQQGHVQRYKAETATSPAQPLHLQVSGRAWHRADRYGAMLGRHPGEDETLALVFARDSTPIDQLKVINSGPNSLTDFGKETRPQFSLEELRETVRLAHARGLPVMVHANGVEPVRQAIEAGADSIEHGYFMGRDNLARLAEKRIFWVPTVFAMQALTNKVLRISPPAERVVAALNVKSQLQQLAWAKELGVPVATGTDAGCYGVMHGEALVEEMKMLGKGGYSLPEVIQAASQNGASLLGLEDLGRIAPGRPADFLVVQGTPAQLPRKLAYLEAIYRNGEPVPSSRAGSGQ